MLIPLNQDLSIPVELLVPTEVPPLFLRGQLCRREEDCLELAVDCDLDLVGKSVILMGTSDSHLHARGRVQLQDGRRLRICCQTLGSSDERSSPRSVGLIDLALRFVDGPGEAEATAWLLNAQTLIPVEDWRYPDPEMEFSLSGLRFYDDPGYRVGGLVLMQILLPTSPEKFRCTGIIRRVRPGPDGLVEVAVELQQVSDEAMEELLRYAIECPKGDTVPMGSYPFQ